MFRGGIVNKISPTIDEEDRISNHLMKKHVRNGYALGSAVVCNFSYNYQKEYLWTANIIDKYDNLSNVYLSETDDEEDNDENNNNYK